MKKGFYSRLALSGMRKNKRIYLPYLLTGIGMVMMFYIVDYLSHSPMLENMGGGRTMKEVLMLGWWVIAVFSAIFLLYTNSFLIRRRDKELGLYNILGMNKGNITRILIWETLLSAAISLFAGLLLGVVFSKLAELLLVNIVREDISFSLSVSFSGLCRTAEVFGAIFLLLLLRSVAKISLSKPLDLMKSDAAGEKPPRANWLLAAVGVVLLGAAYYMAVSIKEPITAMLLFFVAVVLVIAATYLLFIAGSVVLCKLLQKNKKYYYQPRHFVSVSSMAYRMKRNGAGLASICILSTMVLVMLSSTSCLYIGAEDSLQQQYPRSVCLTVRTNSTALLSEETLQELYDRSYEAASSCTDIRDVTAYCLSDSAGMLTGNGNMELDSGLVSNVNYDKLRQLYFLPLSFYSEITGEAPALQDGEALLWSDGKPYADETLTIGSQTLKITNVKEFPERVIFGQISAATCYYIFLPNYTDYISVLAQMPFTYDRAPCESTWKFAFNCEKDAEVQNDAAEAMITACSDYLESLPEGEKISVWFTAAEESRVEFYSLYGSLFFIGILLSLVFIAAAVLIIYYKQISEGYEDQSRFAIMQKVGMTKKEIRRSIDSQVLTVFYAPLLMAGIHLAFAFPLIWKIIRFFGISNLPLLIGVNVVCYLIFAVFYTLVYRITAHSYYKIVSE